MSEELRIESIAAGGAGIGRGEDGRAVFVHRTAPGERVAVRRVEERARWARGELLAVMEASASRREAPCRYYARCGGCTLEHLDYGAQLEAKRRIVADALERIGGVPFGVPPVTPSPREFRYRNRISFTVVRTRDGRVLAGFHELTRPDRVVDMDGSCLMPEEAVAAAWSSVRQHWGRGASRLPAGLRLRVTIRATTTGECALLVQGGHGPGRAEELIESVPGLVAVWHQPRASAAPVLLAGAAALREQWHDEELDLGGAVFLQVNRGAASLLEDHVLGRAGDVSGLRIVDAYCGAGLHARRLARQGAQVTGIELDGMALAEARRAVPSATWIEGRVEDVLPGALPANLLILNPPRAGLATEVAGQILSQPPSHIIYVSCDPATLARDVRRLSDAYRVDDVRCFDLFPQTSHVETVLDLKCSIM